MLEWTFGARLELKFLIQTCGFLKKCIYVYVCMYEYITLAKLYVFSNQNLHINAYTVIAVFIITKNWKLPMGPSTGEYIST